MFFHDESLCCHKIVLYFQSGHITTFYIIVVVNCNYDLFYVKMLNKWVGRPMVIKQNKIQTKYKKLKRSNNRQKTKETQNTN